MTLSLPSCTIVIKLGTSSIVDEETHQPRLAVLSSVVETVYKLRKQGHRVIIVSSGAVGIGLQRMQKSAPSKVSAKQALAAIGQGRLIGIWDNLFGQMGIPVAQILLTVSDVVQPHRYANAVNTLESLLSYGVVPIVNENDTVSVEEIKFGDNDRLSAITSLMMRADYLFLLTDVDCLFTANPRSDPSAQPIEVVSSVSAIRNQVNTSSAGSNMGTGGMATKLIAAEIACNGGVTTIITCSDRPDRILQIIDYDSSQHSNLTSSAERGSLGQNGLRPAHTLFLPSTSPTPPLATITSLPCYSAGRLIAV